MRVQVAAVDRIVKAELSRYRAPVFSARFFQSDQVLRTDLQELPYCRQIFVDFVRGEDLTLFNIESVPSLSFL